MKNIFIALAVVLLPLVLKGQDESNRSFKIAISKDTILLGNYFEVRFTAANIKGEFEAPPFKEFEFVGGPNQSSTMSIVNGVTSQTVSYSYFLKPKEPGTFFIEPAYMLGKDEQFETPPTEVLCLPNPGGIVEESRINDEVESFEFGKFPFLRSPQPSTKKKKLKVTKI